MIEAPMDLYVRRRSSLELPQSVQCPRDRLQDVKARARLFHDLLGVKAKRELWIQRHPKDLRRFDEGEIRRGRPGDGASADENPWRKK